MPDEATNLYWNKKEQRTTRKSLRSLGNYMFPTHHQDKDLNAFLDKE